MWVEQLSIILAADSMTPCNEIVLAHWTSRRVNLVVILTMSLIIRIMLHFITAASFIAFMLILTIIIVMCMLLLMITKIMRYFIAVTNLFAFMLVMDIMVAMWAVFILIFKDWACKNYDRH